MSKYEEANLILKLYELRREDTMRKARNWIFANFNPESLADFNREMFGEHGGYLRMVISYWDLAATLVKTGAISQELFDATCGESLGVFTKVEPFLEQLRASYGPKYLANLEQAIEDGEGGRARIEMVRARMKSMTEEMMSRNAAAAGQK